ncbi:MAG: MFS transporter [Hyphomicrobiaceae bacterium]
MAQVALEQAVARRLVAIVCAAQVLVQIGAFFWPALLPRMIPLWDLSNTQAGWITASFYAAYMLAVPILVTLTDRVDAKFVYLFGVGATIAGHGGFALFAEGYWSAMTFRALTGLGWAGTYMTGLKLLADQVDAKMMSRAVTGHAASIGISGALSFATGDLLANLGGWQLAFLAAALSAATAWCMVAFLVPRRAAPAAKPSDGGGLFNFLPVLRNRSAMAYATAYCVHTLELSALRGWGVAFLGYVAASTGAGASLLSPATVMTLLALMGVTASVMGNEAAIRLGRRRLIKLAMTGSIVIALAIGVFAVSSYWLAVALLLVYGIFGWLDSSSLTAGAAGTAEPARRGATLAVHSSLGYGGGLVGPIVVGWSLDWAGGMSPLGWVAGFGSVAMLMLAALLAFWLMRPRGLAGDKGG